MYNGESSSHIRRSHISILTNFSVHTTKQAKLKDILLNSLGTFRITRYSVNNQHFENAHPHLLSVNAFDVDPNYHRQPSVAAKKEIKANHPVGYTKRARKTSAQWNLRQPIYKSTLDLSNISYTLILSFSPLSIFIL